MTDENTTKARNREVPSEARKTETLLADIERLNHRLRTPLHTVLASAELLRDRAPNDAQADIIQGLLEAAEAAIGALDGFLAASKTMNPTIADGGRARGRVQSFEDVVVLLADDNRVSLTLTKEILEREGFAVRTAVDGREALDVYNTRDVTLVVLDLEMPIMTGWQACAKIRESEAKKGVHGLPIVAITAGTGVDPGPEARSTGFDAVLAKPFGKAELLALLADLLAKKASSGA